MQIQPANSDPVDDFKAELPLLLFFLQPDCLGTAEEQNYCIFIGQRKQPCFESRGNDLRITSAKRLAESNSQHSSELANNCPLSSPLPFHWIELMRWHVHCMRHLEDPAN
jgi:hypothetical protein